jgi:hypothetical protein
LDDLGERSAFTLRKSYRSEAVVKGLLKLLQDPERVEDVPALLEFFRLNYTRLAKGRVAAPKETAK